MRPPRRPGAVGRIPALASLLDAEAEPEASRLRNEARRLFRVPARQLAAMA
ncbi:hypothetical protein OG194_09320 [Streptomyces sp. NBC_01288]|uniref:hypothetical protein n=1 Tax=Streptomyces sp. NBC_01288 TaxID=2903814 RepID=UPI002E160D2F|nr:hypothetical protein OG194_09320 [Streptomyces sp. NBC_01288]